MSIEILQKWRVIREITEEFEVEASTKKEAEDILAVWGDPAIVTINNEIWKEVKVEG